LLPVTERIETKRASLTTREHSGSQHPNGEYMPNAKTIWIAVIAILMTTMPSLARGYHHHHYRYSYHYSHRYHTAVAAPVAEVDPLTSFLNGMSGAPQAAYSVAYRRSTYVYGRAATGMSNAYHSHFFRPVRRSFAYARRIPFKVYAGSRSLLGVASNYIGYGNFTNQRGPWCAAAMRKWVALAGGTPVQSDRAIDWRYFGHASELKPGAVLVWRHHTGIYAGNGMTLSGNGRGRRVHLGHHSLAGLVAIRSM